MLLRQFFGQNLHFVLSILMALAAFAVFWLIFDAWNERRQIKELLKWSGFLLLAIGFLLYAAVINQSSFGKLDWNSHLSVISALIRLTGYIAIIIGLILDPLQVKPKTQGIEEIMTDDEARSSQTKKLAGGFGLGALAWGALLPLGSLGVAGLYWRRATTGLEHHLKPVAVAFAWLTSFELFSLMASSWQNTTNPTLYPLVSSFGYFWVAAQISLLIAAIVLVKWVWVYLLKRLQGQLFIIFTAATAIIFSLSTISFSYLLMNSGQQSSLTNLSTASQLLNQALISKGAQTLADADILSENPSIATAIVAEDHAGLSTLTSGYLVNKGLASFIITASDGEVLDQGQNPDRWGQSISSNPLYQRAILGYSAEGKVAQAGILAPSVMIEAATPIRDSGGSIVGVAITEQAIDSSFLDSIKHTTNLDSAIYAGNEVSATTFVSADGTSRSIGVIQPSKQVRQQVLVAGQTFKGSLSIQNRSFLAVYAPVKDVNNNVIGMLLTAQPEQTLLKTIAHSIELTFISAIGLLLVMIAPAYLLAKRMARQFQ
jgi:hypothetical protein